MKTVEVIADHCVSQLKLGSFNEGALGQRMEERQPNHMLINMPKAPVWWFVKALGVPGKICQSLSKKSPPSSSWP